MTTSNYLQIEFFYNSNIEKLKDEMNEVLQILNEDSVKKVTFEGLFHDPDGISQDKFFGTIVHSTNDFAQS